MADYRPEMVEAAMRELGASRTEMRGVNARWQRIVRSRAFPQGVRRYEAVIGPPEETRERRVGDVSCRVAWWRLSLWPELRFETLLGPDGTVLHEWLVRADGAGPRTVDEMVPWSCVVGDLDAFGPVEHFAGDAPSRWHVRFGADGETYVAHFVWGLLQDVVSG
ncbi:hypothetical protein ACFQHO_03470 [Actinomadura yumaensis]|nr:hypothetical protein [Actinomadura sp. J1-007]